MKMSQINMRSLFKDMLGYLPAQIIPAVAGIALLPVVTPYLTPEEFGQYTLVIATVSVLTVLPNWLSIAVLRFYPACKDEKSLKALYGSVVLWLGISVAVLAIIFLFITFNLVNSMPAQLFKAMLIGVILFIFLAVFDVFQSLMRIRRMVQWFTLFAVWRSLAGLGLGIWLIISWQRGMDGLLWGTILSLMLTIPFMWAIAKRGVSFRIKDFSSKLSKEMAKYSLPLVVGNLAAWILRLSDRYILEIFHGSGEVGLYSVSYRVSEASIMLLVSLFAFAFNPLVITIWEQDGDTVAREFLERGTRYFLILSLPAVVGLSVLQKPIVELLVTEEYWAGATVLPWVAVGVLFLGLTQRFGAGLSIRKRTAPSMLIILVAGGVNIGLNLVFIPQFGFMAAAFSTTVSYAFLFVLMVWVSRRHFRWPFPSMSLVRVLVASTILGVVVYFVSSTVNSSQLMNLALTIPSGIIVYVGILLLLGELQQDEKRGLVKFGMRHLPNRLIPDRWKQTR